MIPTPMEHPLISLLDTPTLPVAFSSRNRHRNPKGCILANDEFYVVFESYPLVVKQMAQLMSEQRFDLIPIEYLYAASVFYRKSRNPHGPSSRPIYAPGALGLAHRQAEGAGRGLLRLFPGTGSRQHGPAPQQLHRNFGPGYPHDRDMRTAERLPRHLP